MRRVSSNCETPIDEVINNQCSLQIILSQLLVEVHYKHPDMSLYGWDVFSRSRSDAQALFTKARDAGMFIHPWP